MRFEPTENTTFAELRAWLNSSRLDLEMKFEKGVVLAVITDGTGRSFGTHGTDSAQALRRAINLWVRESGSAHV